MGTAMDEVVAWVVRDVPGGDGHQTEWRAAVRDWTLVVRRDRGRFACWIERAGAATRWARCEGLALLVHAQRRVVEAAETVLNGRAVADAEYDAQRVRLLGDLGVAYDAAAARVAAAGLCRAEAADLRRALDAAAAGSAP